MVDSLAISPDTLIYNPKLSQLNPIYMPEPVSFEPVTIGWRLLLGIAVLFVLFLIYKLFRKYQSNAYRRSFVRELKKIEPAIGKASVTEILQSISIILKSTAFISYSRDKVARLSGVEWENFLIATYPSGTKPDDTFKLLARQYEPEVKLDLVEIDKLINASIGWVRRRHV